MNNIFSHSKELNNLFALCRLIILKYINPMHFFFELKRSKHNLDSKDYLALLETIQRMSDVVNIREKLF